MTKKLFKILVDLDGVICNLDATLLKTYRLKFPSLPYIPLQDRVGQCSDLQYLEKFGPKEASAVQKILKTPGFYRTIEPNPDAIKGIKELNKRRDLKLYICTSPWHRNPTCVQDKIDWIGEHLGKSWVKKTIITPDKSLIKGDVLLDDRCDIDKLGKVDFQHVMVRCEHNEGVKNRFVLEN